MRLFAKSRPITLTALCLSLLAGCGTLDKYFPDNKADYKAQSQSVPTLEVPPDLTMSTVDDAMAVPDLEPGGGSASYSDYRNERGTAGTLRGPAVLIKPDTIRVERDGDKRWLVMEGDPSAVWGRMRDFWLQSGFLIKREDPRIGILETDWAENRADIPMDPVRGVISKVFDSLYSSPTRDMYRVRLEAGVTPGTTELYLTHRGVEEVARGDNFVWQPRPADPELEAEMLSRMMVFFGMDEQRSKTLVAGESTIRPRATLTTGADGQSTLRIDEDFSRAWRRTGMALDRVGFAVEDRDRTNGLYYVHYEDPLAEEDNKGFLSSLKFWGDSDEIKKAKYQIHLDADGAGTAVTVRDKDGKQEKSSTATRILTLLEEQLK